MTTAPDRVGVLVARGGVGVHAGRRSSQTGLPRWGGAPRRRSRTSARSRAGSRSVRRGDTRRRRGRRVGTDNIARAAAVRGFLRPSELSERRVESDWGRLLAYVSEGAARKENRQDCRPKPNPASTRKSLDVHRIQATPRSDRSGVDPVREGSGGCLRIRARGNPRPGRRRSCGGAGRDRRWPPASKGARPPARASR